MTTPEVCHVCGVQQDCGAGMGFTSYKDKDPRWLCIDCVPLIEDIRRIKRLDAYEHKALDRVDEIASDYCAEAGQTDMAEMDELTRRMLWKTVVQGYGRELRAAIRSNDAPF